MTKQPENDIVPVGEDAKPKRRLRSLHAPIPAKGKRHPDYRLDMWIVHSYLIYRDRLARGAGVKEIERETGIEHRKLTIAPGTKAKRPPSSKPVLDTLERLRCIERVQSGKRITWEARYPDQEQFARKKLEYRTPGRHWSEWLATVHIRRLPKPGAKIGKTRFSMRLCFVFWIIRSFCRAKKGEDSYWKTSNPALRKLLGINRQTVENYLDALTTGRLILLEKSGYDYRIRICDYKYFPHLFELEEGEVKTLAGRTPLKPKPPVLTEAKAEDDWASHDAEANRRLADRLSSKWNDVLR